MKDDVGSDIIIFHQTIPRILTDRANLVLCQVCSVQKVAGIFVDNKANIFSIALAMVKIFNEVCGEKN